MGGKLLLEEDVTDADCVIVLAEELVDASESHGEIGENVHLLVEFIVCIVSRERRINEAVVHGFEALNECGYGFREYQLIEVMFLHERQIVVPELNRPVEYQPTLLTHLTQLDSLLDVLAELHLPLEVLGLVLVSELSVSLVLIDCYQVLASYLYILLQ